MGFEYSLKTDRDTGKVISILEHEWNEILNDKKDLYYALPEELTRCTLLHGYDTNGNDGFSFCDPVTAVGWHEIIQVCPLWDRGGNPYIHILCLGNSMVEHYFFQVVENMLKANKVNYMILELEE